jgi:hypothetical protein
MSYHFIKYNESVIILMFSMDFKSSNASEKNIKLNIFSSTSEPTYSPNHQCHTKDSHDKHENLFLHLMIIHLQ